MDGISLLAAIAAVRVRRAASARVSQASASAIAGVVYIAIVVVAGLALPTVNEVPRAFPATTLWQFRQASVGMNAVLWATIGLVFAAAVGRVMAGRPVLPWARRPREAEAGGGGRARGPPPSAPRPPPRAPRPRRP